VILLRRRDSVEMLMIERPVKAAFGGLWAFPGGAVEPIDQSAQLFGFDDSWRAAALRETAEEVGIFLTDPPSASPGAASRDVFGALERAGARFDPGRLRYVASWITPEQRARRFEARFYIAEVAPEVEGDLHTDELVDMAWLRPEDAIRLAEASRWHMARPTRWLVEQLVTAGDPGAMPQHPVRMLKNLEEPFEVLDLGFPPEEAG
jgi:8-oxo-dGTP pyrophosphatase MutT (NUDIX family)